MAEDGQPKAELVTSPEPAVEGGSSSSSAKPIEELDEKTAQLIKEQAQASFVVHGEEGVSKSLHADDGLEQKSTIFFKNCKNGNYTIDSQCTKILIEGCENTVITLNGGIYTEVVEIWRCNSFQLKVNTRVKTLQLDICRAIDVHFTNPTDFDQVVWSNLHDFQLKVEEHHLVTGVPQVKELHEDLNEETDQFIIRIIKGKLLQEIFVRLANGFPTTEREAKEFDERQERNNQAREAYVRRLLNKKGHKIAPELNKLKKDESKAGRNDNCPCNSGKKFKKCCGSASAVKQKQQKAQEFVTKPAEPKK